MKRKVRCPSGECGATFEVDSDRLGRSMSCPVCDGRMTARPLEVERRLRVQQERITGGAGQPLARLPLVTLIDNVRSLWNVGSIFRTADACGVEHLALCGITGCPPREEISKTALGAEEAVAWSYHADAAEAVEQFREQRFVPVALEATDGAIPLDEFEWPQRVALVVGNEVAGVGPRLLDACEARVSIPMYGIKDSLNVAVAFGIAAHHAARQLDARRAASEVHR